MERPVRENQHYVNRHCTSFILLWRNYIRRRHFIIFCVIQLSYVGGKHGSVYLANILIFVCVRESVSGFTQCRFSITGHSMHPKTKLLEHTRIQYIHDRPRYIAFSDTRDYIFPWIVGKI